MPYLTWDSRLDTGVSVIDSQHHRIVDYINELQDAIAGDDRQMVQAVLDDLVDYTVSHFAFEEHLQEQAQYPSFDTHKQKHEEFARQIHEYRDRFRGGEDIAGQLLSDLREWLIRHVQEEDAAFVGAAREKMEGLDQSWIAKTIASIFG